MKKSIFKKLGGLFLGLAMGLGVAVGVTAGNKASETRAASNTFSMSSNYSSTSSTTAKLVWADNYVTITQEKGSGSSFSTSYTTAPRWYSGNTITFIPASGVTITKMVFTTSQGKAAAGTWSTGSGSDNTWTGSSSASFTETHPSTQSRPTSIAITYTSGSTEYTVSFNANGGEGSMNSISASSLLSAPDCGFAAPVGKIFDYWSTSLGGSAIVYPLQLSQNTTLYANWKVDEPNLTITIDNFTEITTSYTTAYTHNYSINSTSIPVEAYGVYKNASGIQMNSGKGTYIKNTQPLGVKIVKIQCTWTATGKNSINMYVSENNVASSSSTSLGEGSNTQLVQVFEVTDSTKEYQYFYFDGSTVSGACYLTELKIYYTETAPKHSVSYSNGGGTGTAPASSQVAEGKSFTAAQNTFTKTGYTFNGWKDQNGNSYSAGTSYTMGTSDLTLTAQWTVNSYTLSYNANGGTGSVSGGTHNYGSTFDLSSSTFSKTGYTQDGWATSTGGAKVYELGGSYTYNTAGAVTLYAHWVANQYTISYNANGGEGEVASQTADYNSSVTLASSGFTKAHYDLDGWATTSDGDVEYKKGATITMPLDGLTLYAHYSIQCHIVTYDGNEGTPDLDEDILNYGDDIDLTIGATLRGYHLLGWALPGSDDILTSLKMGDADITLHAVWEQDAATYSFTAFANDGTTTSSLIGNEYHNGDEITMPDPSTLGFERTGYTALGWATTANATQIEFAAGSKTFMEDADFDIYVVWQKHLAAKPTISCENFMWVDKTQELTVNYTPGAVTLNLTSSAPGVVSVSEKSVDVENGKNIYTLTAVSEGTATITAKDDFYSNTATITTENDGIKTLTITGSLPTGTYYVGHPLNINNITSGLSISGEMKSGGYVTPSSGVTWKFSNGSTSITLTEGLTKVSVQATFSGVSSNVLDLPITLTAVQLDTVSVAHSSKTYTIGDSLDLNAITVSGKNNDGSAATVSKDDFEFTYAADAFLKEGTPTITATHKTSGKTTTFNVEVKKKTLQPETSKWTLVEDITDLEIGDKIIITNSEHSQALGGQNSNNRGQVGVTYANKELTIGDSSPAILELKAGNKDGTYSFYDSTNSGYLYAASGSSNYLRVESSLSDNSSFKLTTNSAIAQGTNTRNSIRYNKSSNCFSCYASGQAEINFFVQEVTPGESRTLAGITATYNHTGDTYYTGDEVVSADFTVKAWYNNGDTVNNVSGFTITDSTLFEGDNTIELSYEGKKCTVLVSDIETRTATVDHVYVETETGYQVNYYLDGTTAAWNLEKINVVAYWTDGTTNTSSLSDLVESGDVTLTKAAPEVGDTSFTVSGSYYGSAIDSTHNSVTVSVVAKAISSLSWTGRFDGYSLNVFEGDSINKSVFAKQNSSSCIKADFNDGSSDNRYSIDNCSVALYRREENKNVWVKDVTFDEKGNYTFEAEDDGLYFLLTAGGKTTQYSSSAIFHVCEKLNDIIVPGENVTFEYTANSFIDLPSSAGGEKTYTVENISFTTDGLYGYKGKNQQITHIALGKNDGKYLSSSAFPNDFVSIKLTESSEQSINNAATIYFSKDGITYDLSQKFTDATLTYEFNTPEKQGYKFFKIVTDGTNYTNIESIEVVCKGNTDVANTNFVTQKSVIEFAKYFYEELNEVCNSFDTTSDAFKEAWSNVSNKYDEMFGSSSTIEDLDKTLAANMFKYAYPNGRVGEEADVLQLAMQRYDTIVARDASLSKFITRASSYNAPRVNNPIANLSNVDNSVWVISAVALVGLTAIGGYFFYRKRKEI